MGLGTLVRSPTTSLHSPPGLSWAGPAGWESVLGGHHAHSQRASCPRRWHDPSRCPPLEGRGLLGSKEPFISLGI